jgi:hypothetical protein
MSTTAGGTTVAGKLDEEMSVCYDSDGHCSDVSVNETVQGRDKKTATSTSSSAKNPKRRRDRLTRMKTRLQEKLGDQFEWDEREEAEKSCKLSKEEWERRAREN